MRSGAVLIAILLITAAPAWAQDTSGVVVDPEMDQLPPPRSTIARPRAGQTAESAVGQVGVRQTRDRAESFEPMARINNRIQNRVQARLYNRIDRYYDPRANATSAFRAADGETQRSGRRLRR